MTPQQEAKGASVLQRAIWGTADKFLRGTVEEEDYGDYIIPFAVLRRLECLLEYSKPDVLAYLASTTYTGAMRDMVIQAQFGLHLYNSSPLDLASITATDDNVASSLSDYVAHFSDSIRDIWEKFDFARRMKTLEYAGRLYGVCRHFAELDMHPDSPDRIPASLRLSRHRAATHHRRPPRHCRRHRPAARAECHERDLGDAG